MRGNGTLAEKAGVVELNLEPHVPQGDRYKHDPSPLLKEALISKYRNVTSNQ